MAITPHTRGRWRADIRDKSGKRYRPSFATREQAEIWEAEARLAFLRDEAAPLTDAMVSRRVATAANRHTLLDALDLTWDLAWQHQKDGPQSRDRGRKCLDILGEDLPVDAVDRDALRLLQQTIQRRGVKPATVNRYTAAMSRILRTAEEAGWINSKPRASKLREPAGRVRWFTDEEQNQMVKWCADDDRLDLARIITWLADTGMRRSEAMNLKWSDRSGSGVTVRDPKSGHARTVPLTEAAAAVWDSAREDWGEAKGPWETTAGAGWLTTQWNQMKDALGFSDDPEYLVHTLRHTFCSRLAMAGVDLNRIKELAGHRSMTTTLRYAHLRTADLQTAIEALQHR